MTLRLFKAKNATISFQMFHDAPAKARGYVLPALVSVSVFLCVCLFVTTITKKIVDGFVPNFMERFLGEREDQARVSLGSVEGCESNGKKLRKPAIVYILYVYNSRCGKSVAKCWRQTFARSCTLSEYFPFS